MSTVAVAAWVPIGRRDDRHGEQPGGREPDQGWAHFTPHLPEVIEDPYPAFRWLRDHAPAFHVVSEDIWVLSRYADVVAAARDPLTYSQTESVGYSRHRGKGLALTALDPPDHTELRRLDRTALLARARCRPIAPRPSRCSTSCSTRSSTRPNR